MNITIARIHFFRDARIKGVHEEIYSSMVGYASLRRMQIEVDYMQTLRPSDGQSVSSAMCTRRAIRTRPESQLERNMFFHGSMFGTRDVLVSKAFELFHVLDLFVCYMFVII